MFFTTPLDQFQIISLFSIKVFCFDISFTNSALICLIMITVFMLLITYLSSDNGTFFFIPSSWQVIVEIVYETVTQLLYDNLGEKGEKYFPFVAVLFTFILLANLIGLIPYSFTVTSHLTVTFLLALTVFIGVNIICYQEHKLNMISLFIPSNTSFFLALLLVPIEFVSYMFKPISLGVRLFANMMAGHTLLKVIAGFAWSMVSAGGFLFFAHIIPLVVLILLVGLELGVALIQAYVFTILTCIYLNDSINLH